MKFISLSSTPDQHFGLPVDKTILRLLEESGFLSQLSPIYLSSVSVSILVTTHVSCRLPGSIGEQIDSVAAENNAFRSEVVRRAIRYYLSENPDGIDVIDRQQPSNSPAHSPSETPTAPDQPPSNAPYDPTEELF